MIFCVAKAKLLNMRVRVLANGMSEDSEVTQRDLEEKETKQNNSKQVSSKQERIIS